MADPFEDLNKAVLTALGQTFEWQSGDADPVPLQGILRRNVQPVGTFDAVMQSHTELTVPNTISLQRNDLVSTTKESWRVDRKLKDDGLMATWSLHAD